MLCALSSSASSSLSAFTLLSIRGALRSNETTAPRTPPHSLSNYPRGTEALTLGPAAALYAQLAGQGPSCSPPSDAEAAVLLVAVASAFFLTRIGPGGEASTTLQRVHNCMSGTGNTSPASGPEGAARPQHHHLPSIPIPIIIISRRAPVQTAAGRRGPARATNVP
eukprot:scaffold3443_cov404-Prasinococcus_capsulatus_cf.AAC.10